MINEKVMAIDVLVKVTEFLERAIAKDGFAHENTPNFDSKDKKTKGIPNLRGR